MQIISLVLHLTQGVVEIIPLQVGYPISLYAICYYINLNILYSVIVADVASTLAFAAADTAAADVVVAAAPS